MCWTEVWHELSADQFLVRANGARAEQQIVCHTSLCIRVKSLTDWLLILNGFWLQLHILAPASRLQAGLSHTEHLLQQSNSQTQQTSRLLGLLVSDWVVTRMKTFTSDGWEESCSHQFYIMVVLFLRVVYLVQIQPGVWTGFGSDEPYSSPAHVTSQCSTRVQANPYTVCSIKVVWRRLIQHLLSGLPAAPHSNSCILFKLQV